MESAQKHELADRRARVCDLRAAMSDESGVEKYLNGLKPKRNG